MTWDGIVTSYHKKYRDELEITDNIQAYIQSRVLKKTLESISFEQRRKLGKDDDYENIFKTATGESMSMTPVNPLLEY